MDGCCHTNKSLKARSKLAPDRNKSSCCRNEIFQREDRRYKEQRVRTSAHNTANSSHEIPKGCNMNYLMIFRLLGADKCTLQR